MAPRLLQEALAVSAKAWTAFVRRPVSCGPAPREGDHLLFVIRPVAQGGRVEVRFIGPDDRVNVRVDRHGIETVQIAECTVQLTLEHGAKVDRAHQTIGECDFEAIRPGDLESRDPVNRMRHRSRLSKHLDRRFHQARLSGRHVTADELDRIDREDADHARIVRGIWSRGRSRPS